MADVQFSYRRSVEVAVDRIALADSGLRLGGSAPKLTLRNLRELVSQADAVRLSDDAIVTAAIYGDVYTVLPAVVVSVGED